MDLFHSGLANAGTPLMWASCCMLVFGNALIGAFENWLIDRKHGTGQSPPIAMILANYASMLAGIGVLFLLEPVRALANAQPFTIGRPAYVGFWFVAFVVTVLVEWPFVAWTADLPWRSKASFLESLRVQAWSYLILVPPFFFIGSISAYTKLKPVAVELLRTVPGWVYYIGPDRNSVWRIRLDGTSTERVTDLPEPERPTWSRLSIEPTRNGDRARLLFRIDNRNYELISKVGEARQASPVKNRMDDGLAYLGNATFMGATKQFAESPKVFNGYWALEGIRIDGEHFALESPVFAMAWRCPVVLPDGKVLAQFGEAIVLIDPKTNRVAELAVGSGPDVLIDLPPGPL